MAFGDIKLKDDWVAPPGSSGEALAAFLNEVANQLNNGEVPSGGTMRVTSGGLRIEVGSDSADHFLVEKSPDNPTTHVVVSGGWWAYYYQYLEEATEELAATPDPPEDCCCPEWWETLPEAEWVAAQFAATARGIKSRRVQLDAPQGTSADSLGDEIEITGSGFIVAAADVVNNTLEIVFLDAVPEDTDPVEAGGSEERDPKIFRKILATITFDDSGDGEITAIEQNWTGGNILTLLPDAVSDGVDEGQGGVDPTRIEEREDEECDQNEHPQDEELEEGEYDCSGGGVDPDGNPCPEPPHPDDTDPEGGGEGGGGEENENEHPSDDECYSTIPDDIP
ncbi:MAG: hypothetical protein GY820_39750 [Gammaproteobacteria bacterium]|nr:hypothetical protein [Gammaproteobacteria bacterium]